MNMKYEPDIEAEITFLSTEQGGKTRPASSGYRPNHLIKQHYLTSGEHTYINVQEVLPGQTARVYIKFITPEAYPNILWVGKIINVQEASRIVGYAKVLKIFNKLLETSSEQPH
jgi:translation elongation factor EF-Tu-like GTPase